MFKRYVSIMASVLLAVTILLPASSSVALANTDVQQNNTSMQAATYTVDLEVEGLAGVILKEPIQVTEGQHALDALKKALDSKSIDYSIIESEWGAYVSSINNEEAGKLGGWDGWNYTVNGQAPSVGAASYVLKNTDDVKFFYSRWAAISSTTQVIEHSENPIITVNLIGDTFTPAALEPKNWTVGQSNLTISTVTQDTDQQVTIQLNGKVERENFSLVASEATVVGKAADALQITVVSGQARVPEAIKKVTDYILSKSVSSEWTAVGLAKAGVVVPESYEEIFEQNVQQQIVANLERLKITDAERLTIAAVAIGRDPKNINGIDLHDKIYNSINIRNVDTMTRQGTNGLIFALVALDTKERMNRLLASFGISHLRARHPYDCSGGEVQKAALACILMGEPEMLFIDEPTKGMDPVSKRHLGELLYGLQQDGLTIFMVTHDIGFAASYAERCAMMFDGEIAADGTPDELFKGNYFYTTAINRATRETRRPEVLTYEEAVATWGVRESIY